MPEEKPSTKPYGEVYLLFNRVTEKVYVGQTRNGVNDRWGDHLYSARHGSQQQIHQAIRKHGGESFEIAILAVAHSKSDLNDKETAAIYHYKSATYACGYNMAPAAYGNSEESLQRLRERFSGSGNPMFGKPGTRLGVKTSPETLAKRAATFAQRKAAGLRNGGPDWTEERLAQFRTTMARRKSEGLLTGVKTLTPNGGYRHTAKSKKKISEAKKGQPLHLSPEARLARAARTIALHRGRKRSDETKAKNKLRWEEFRSSGRKLNLSAEAIEVRRQQAAKMRAIAAERRAKNGKSSSDLA